MNKWYNDLIAFVRYECGILAKSLKTYFYQHFLLLYQKMNILIENSSSTLPQENNQNIKSISGDVSHLRFGHDRQVKGDGFN